MLEIFDKNRKKLAILQNAFDLKEVEKINAVSMFNFSLPIDDPKNEFCQYFNLIRYDDGEYYQIIQIVGTDDELGTISYECEHVIALLLNDAMPGFVNVGGLGYYTRNVIDYVLNKQKAKRWILNECDFSRQFEYGWEKESLLTSLFSIPERFVEPYMWRFDTSSYPYKLSLKAINKNKNPDHYIRKGHNRLKLVRQSSARQIRTRIYPYGAGEGVNQLGISEVNNGITYLQSPQAYIDKYGLIELVWSDRRYTDAQSLKDAAQVMLNELQEPLMEYETEFIGNCKVGDTVKVVETGYISYIVEITRTFGEIPQQTVKIANRPTDIAGTVADLADRMRIEMTYSQGATQVYAASIADNADSKNPVELRFFIPNAMININAVTCKIRLSAFRAYSKASEGGGGFNTTSSSGGSFNTTSSGGGSFNTTSSSGGSFNTTSSSGGSFNTTSSSGGGFNTTSSSGGGINTTSSSGGGTNTTTASGGGEVNTTTYNGGASESTSSGGGVTSFGASNYTTTTANVAVLYGDAVPYHAHGLEGFVTGHSHDLPTHIHQFFVPGHYHSINIHPHSHGITIQAHTHTVQASAHTHTVQVSAHTHTVQVSTHSHTVQVSAHTHTVQVSAHTHTVQVSAHTHTVQAQNHVHNITPVIQTFGNPSSFWLIVNGVERQFFNGRDAEVDITAFLIKDTKIPRGVWHTIGILPNDLAHVEISYNVQGFIQSRGDRSV